MEHNIEKAQLVEVIKIELDKGEGTRQSPFRGEVQYWTLDGKLITEIDSLKETQTLGNERVEEETPRKVYIVYYNSYYSDQRCSITEIGEVESELLGRFCTANSLKIIGKYYIREEAEAKLKEVREKGLPRT